MVEARQHAHRAVGAAAGVEESPQDGRVRVFGNYLRKPNNVVRARGRLSTRQELVAKLQEAGVIRRDVDPKIVAHIMNMLAYGLVAMDQIMEASEIPPTAEIVEGIATIFDRALTPEDGGGSEAGTATGPVKVLESPGEKPLNEGDVLVVYTTDPGWTPLFANAAAIVLEVGGVLQHGAIVAREYGKPCVAGIDGVTTKLRDGQRVEVDGGSGVIRLLSGDSSSDVTA